ncbi:FG-GAP repeat protein [Crateriforma conspicua]|nr:FG-GAP repeat protein [Crateriforma conspicua]
MCLSARKLLLALSLILAGSVHAADVSEKSTRMSFAIRPLAVDANEGIAAGDVNRDGHMDLVAGRNWYSGVDWTARPLRTIDDWNGYVQSNGDYLFDVNDDGWLDVIAGSFLPTEVHWYENPGAEGLRLGQQWTQHLLVDTKNSANEGQLFGDIDGDGTPEWIVNSWKAETATTIWRLERIEKTPKAAGSVATKNATGKKSAKAQGKPAQYQMVPHVLGDINGHGAAIGDLSGDGRTDVLVGHGWYEQPAENPWGQPWKFHDAWKLHSSLPMVVADVDSDGDSDLIFGNGHDFGLQWWENTGVDADGEFTWQEHLIDDRFSQPHCLAWVDLDGDKRPELITGKRYFGHNGRDPGGMDMPCLYAYRVDPQTHQFQRFTIDEGHVGTGLQIVAQDLNDDGAVDLAVAGKSGTFVLLAQ